MRHFEPAVHPALIDIYTRYYPGILILTTNRVSVFDEAIQSRIHVSLYYNSLSPETRGRLWRVFLVKAGLGEDQLDAVDPQIMDKLIRLNVNGREIKNIVKTASTFASHRNRCISMEDVNRAVEMDKFAAQQLGIYSAAFNCPLELTALKRLP